MSILLGDFNAVPNETDLLDFWDNYYLKNLVKDKTFQKSKQTELYWSNNYNRPKSFQNSMFTERVLSDFNKMSITVMKTYCSKKKPAIIHYRKFKDFNSDAFIKDFNDITSQENQIAKKRQRLFYKYSNYRYENKSRI